APASPQSRTCVATPSTRRSRRTAPTQQREAVTIVPLPDKERAWTLEASSSPINTIAGAMGPLAGLQGNGILCPTVIDSQGPRPKVELVDCLSRVRRP
ncbi:unnamed protein product, partial [Tetraodon nigroviridis]